MADTSSGLFAKRYAKALCHLNQARSSKRLGLILGSGVSDDLGIPKWPELIEQIDKKLDYKSGAAPESYRAEQLFQHYRITRTNELGWKKDEKLDAVITAGWRELVTKCLYGSFLDENDKLNVKAYEQKIDGHPYLRNLGKLARDAQLVVTHNFDDALESAIDLDPSDAGQNNRRYYSFWRPEPFLRPQTVNIYHPNGFTPLHRNLKGSESLVLTEASFADHLANTNTEESHFLLRHLADKTFLIVGHSLSDGTLKNALRQHANQRPGHVNYYVHWLRDGESALRDEQQRAIREANFETYNLVTLFANSNEINEVLKLVALDESGFRGALAHLAVMSTQYVYFLVGSVSSGKSTTIRHLRNLETIEEWPVSMPPVMNRPSVGLDKTDTETIDNGLEEAIWKKNSDARDIKTGIVAVDRAPLDFIAFPAETTETLGDTARNRTTAVLKRLEGNSFKDLCPGQVIVVQADTDILLERQIQRGRQTTPEDVLNGNAQDYLKRQQDRLAEVYKKAIEGGSVVRTNRCSVAASVKAATRIIHFEDYKPFDFVDRLREIKEGQ